MRFQRLICLVLASHSLSFGAYAFPSPCADFSGTWQGKCTRTNDARDAGDELTIELAQEGCSTFKVVDGNGVLNAMTYEIGKVGKHDYEFNFGAKAFASSHQTIRSSANWDSKAQSLVLKFGLIESVDFQDGEDAISVSTSTTRVSLDPSGKMNLRMDSGDGPSRACLLSKMR